MGNFIASVFLWVWSNFIGWPREKTHFFGLVRMCVTSYFLTVKSSYFFSNPDNNWIVLLGGFLTFQFVLGLLQFFGAHSINGPLDFKLNKEIEEGLKRGDIKDVTRPIGNDFERDYPGLTRWFRVRNHYMSGMSHTEKARFFVDTGALTEGSVREMEKYKSTKRALERLDWECKRPAKELVDYMRGAKV